MEIKSTSIGLMLRNSDELECGDEDFRDLPQDFKYPKK